MLYRVGKYDQAAEAYSQAIPVERSASSLPLVEKKPKPCAPEKITPARLRLRFNRQQLNVALHVSAHGHLTRASRNSARQLQSGIHPLATRR